LIEDVVLGYGYDRIEPQLPHTITYGRELSKVGFTRKVRELMVGFGFQEVANYILTSRDNQTQKMRLEASEKMVEIANPRTNEFAVARTWLLPGILNFLSHNTHIDYPQRVFECGDSILIDGGAETKTRTEIKVAAAICDFKSSYESIQATAYSLLQNLGFKRWKTRSADHPSFIPGRTAKILLGDEEVAILGEVHPEVLTNYGIPNPVTAVEVNLTTILKNKSG
jgi:phenylalanyl-tRNA synthetase beta chain